MRDGCETGARQVRDGCEAGTRRVRGGYEAGTRGVQDGYEAGTRWVRGGYEMVDRLQSEVHTYGQCDLRKPPAAVHQSICREIIAVRLLHYHYNCTHGL